MYLWVGIDIFFFVLLFFMIKFILFISELLYICLLCFFRLGDSWVFKLDGKLCILDGIKFVLLVFVEWRIVLLLFFMLIFKDFFFEMVNNFYG